MQDNAQATKQKITSILKLKGPSLPVQIARETASSSLFAGAFLSELANENAIKISHMKVGGSPLYFLKGQEALLENFYQYLPGKEKEAFLLLKENKILEDKSQQPAIRVALRSIKDFAAPFLKDDKVFWRFHSVSEEEVRKILEPKKIKKPEIKTKESVSKEAVKKSKVKANKEVQLDIGLKQKIKHEKERPEFSLRVVSSLQNNDMNILEEIDVKKREFSAVIHVDSSLGKMKFFCIAKDKKRMTENDLRLAVQKAQALKMPALVLFTQEINKKALEYAETCPLLKLKRLG